MNKIIFKKHMISILFLIIVLFLIYWQGLFGDYVFDDLVNIVENENLKINDFKIETLNGVWFSGDSGPLGRPISYLSFALNYYFTQFDPFYFKLTNLIIHIFNAILIYFISLNLFKFKQIKDCFILAFLVALFWSILPINLTSILYVVQRMTSLCTLFGLISILFYVSFRINFEIKLYKKILNIFFIFLFLIFSILSKESGILFLGLIFLIELFWFEGKNITGGEIKIFNISLNHIVFIIIFLLIFFLLFNIGNYISEASYERRFFSLKERILTEFRVIFYYLKLIFFPNLADLSLYHDDFYLSKSLIYPKSTFYSVLGFILITSVCILLVKKTKLLIFAWGWFIVSHLLESTVFALELVHEHRNYFSSIGFIITIFYFFSILKLKKILYILSISYIIMISLITHSRVLIWSNLVDHAQHEAYFHPNSERANYQLARIYMKLWEKYSDDKYIMLAKESLKKARNSYEPELGSWFAELHLAYALNEEVDVKIKNELIFSLKNKPFYNSTLAFIQAFSRCQIDLDCNMSDLEALEIFAAALENKTLSPQLKSAIYQLIAIYYTEKIGDLNQSIFLLDKAINIYSDSKYYFVKAQIQTIQKDYQSALSSLDKAKEYDSNNLLDKSILLYRIEIRNAMVKNEN